MFQIDDKFLESLGLGALPDADKDTMKNHIYETLEMNVGMRLASNMTDAQLNEFEQLMDQNDESGALKWLETNFPNYKQVVSDELEKLKAEIKQSAPQIVSQAQQGNHPQFSQTAPSQPSAFADQGLGNYPAAPQHQQAQPQQNVQNPFSPDQNQAYPQYPAQQLPQSPQQPGDVQPPQSTQPPQYPTEQPQYPPTPQQ